MLKPAHPLPEEFKAFAPVIYHDLKSGRLLIGSHVEAIRECLGSGAKISSDAAFAGATAGLPRVGAEVTAVTGRPRGTRSAQHPGPVRGARPHQGRGANRIPA